MEDWSPHLMSELKRWAKLLENSFRDAQVSNAVMYIAATFTIHIRKSNSLWRVAKYLFWKPFPPEDPPKYVHCAM